MKKTLLAIAVLAATSNVFAQSSVTVYGVVDASLENVKNDASVTRVSSDNLATSRLGFKGTEAIGDGLNAKFALETAVKADTGAQGNTARFFDRAAWLGLQGGFGELRLGRIDSSIGALAGDTALLGAQAYDDFKIAKTRAGDSYRRVDNAITYLLPTFVPGLTAQLQYSTAVGTSGTAGAESSTAANGAAGKAYGLNAQYVAGPFSAGLGYLAAKDESATAGDQKANATLVYAGYDFGMLKLTGYFDSETKLTGDTDRFRLYGVKVAVPFTNDFVLTTSLSHAKNTGVAATTGDNATFLTFKGVYTLSKRTALYGLLTVVDNAKNAELAIDKTSVPLTADGTSSKHSRGLAFGIRHAF
ncbi:MAG: porin [Pseudomonadota bacterium]